MERAGRGAPGSPHPTGRDSAQNLGIGVPPRTGLLRVLHVPRLVSSRARRSVHSGFDAFYAANYPATVRVAFSLCGSMQVAEELAQEAFVATHRRWRRVARLDRPDLWVRRVVINRAISHRRRQAAERRAMQKLPGPPEQTASNELQHREVWDALRTLSSRQAQVLALVYAEDHPIAEVAEILELGEETVRTHLKRGRAALAQRLEHDAQTEIAS